MHPLTKLAIIIVITSCALVYQSIIILTGLMIFSAILLIFKQPSHQDRNKILRQFRLLLPIILSLFIVQILFVRKGDIILHIGSFNLYDLGMLIALQVTIRLVIILLCAWYVMGLSIRDYLDAFRILHLPEALAVMTSMTMHFLPILALQISRSRQQLILRAIDIKRIGLSSRLHLYLKLVMPILGSTLRNVKYQAIALDIRGFRNGLKHSAYQQRKLQIRDYLVILAVICLPVLVHYSGM